MTLWNAENASPVCRIGIVGDFLPANGLVPAEGQSWFGMAGHVARYFCDLEFSIVNLECPLNVSNARPRVKASLGGSFGAPKEVLNYLQALNVNLIGIANNHICDYQSEGIASTRKVVEDRGMMPLGAGRSLTEPPEVYLWQSPAKFRVGFWAAARGLRESSTHRSQGVEPATLERGRQALQLMKEQGAACRTALLHAGAEHTNYPDPDDVQFMGSLTSLGFDVVAACHSHRISGYKMILRAGSPPAFCFYGLGSLSSGVLYSPLEQEGILPVIGLDACGSVVHIEARPIYLNEFGWGEVPRPEDAKLVMNRFLDISKEILNGTYRDRFYRDISKNLLSLQWRDIRVAFDRAGVRGLVSKMRRLRPAHLRWLLYKGMSSVGLG